MFREKAALNQYILTNRPLRLCQRPFGLTSGATCRRLLVRLKQRVTRAGASRYLVHRSNLWVLVLDATRHYVEMKKSQGNKRHEIGDGLLGKPDHIGDIVRLYDAYRDGATSRVLVAGQEKEVVCARLFDNRDFGYLRLTVERPLRLNFRVTDERRARMAETAAFKAFGVSKKKFGSAAHTAEVHAGTMCQFEVMVAIGTLLSERVYRNRDEFSEVLNAAFKKVGLKVPAPLKKATLTALSERDPTADIPVAESVAKEAPSLS